MNPIRNSAKAIVIEDYRLLVLERKDAEGLWYCLPGGGQEPGETLVETLKRECLEEINAHVEVGNLLFVREYLGKNHEFASQDSQTHAIEFMFECRLVGDNDIRLGDLPDAGQLGVAWLPLDQLDNYRLYPLRLRPLITALSTEHCPVYPGDVN